MSSTITAHIGLGYYEDTPEIVVDFVTVNGDTVTLDFWVVSEGVYPDATSFAMNLLAHGWRSVGDWLGDFDSPEDGISVSVLPTGAANTMG